MKYIGLLFIYLVMNPVFSQKQATLFEENTISNNGAFGLTISPDGKESFWVNSNGGRDTLTIMQRTKVNGKWQLPEITFFSKNRNWKDVDPMFSPDGKMLFFQSNRPVQGFPDKKGFDIWAIKKVRNKWSEPYHLGNTINSDASETFASMTIEGSIYFMKENPNGTGKSDIYVSRYKNNQYQSPQNIGLPINTTERESNPYIAPDEKYIIYFSSKPEGFGDVDLYISFNEKGLWSEPVNLGNLVNSKVGDFCPFYHEKEKKLYFSRTEELPNKRRIENIYSIDLDITKYKK